MAENAQRPAQDARITDMRRQVDEVKNVMAANVASIMERGERLDSIERRTDELQASSANFKLTAHRVQRKMCMLNAKWTIISVIVAIIVACIIIVLILNACGVFDRK
ncbi:Synaptobrevin [Oesophagostomum dentatum]|uniref:Synaptobrevin n=1 Tax=Oesophagostomum dentatum TaxID=61180 RepID=A0A0B1SLV3_OESDE|nr:Synaptobrevin [Oesophagostomum dentatum]